MNYPEPYLLFKNVLEGRFNLQVNTSNRTSNQTPVLLTFDNENEAQTFVSPLLLPAIEILHFEGFDNAAIIDEYGSLTNEKIVICASSLFAVKTKELKLQVGLEENARIGTQDLILDCIKDAAGIAELTVIASVGFNVWLKQMGKKAALRALVKVGAKYFGWIGAAIFAYDVIECIYTGD